MDLYTPVVAAALAMVHLVAGKLRFLEGTPRSVWLSLAGGVSVAYVFLHLLPDLAESREHFRDGDRVWLLAMVGLAAFYGLERLVRTHLRGRERASDGVFWVHLGSFGLYNLLFGYLLHRREENLLVYAAAIALHFVVTDYGMRLDHRDRYDSTARWLLAASLVGGWAIGVVVPVSRTVTSGLFAVLAGGIVLNVLKEELPEDRESRFWAFAGGAGGYALLLLAV